MSVFDQRDQRVNYQYSAANNINFGNVQNKVDIAKELQNLKEEVTMAVQAGALDEEIAIDVESSLKKAMIQAQKPNPDKKTIQDYIEQAKKLLQGIVSVGGLVTGLSEVAKAVGTLL